ncbi:MAG: sulfurtransferase TusA family protein, partial [Thomasclavelia sp.]
MKKILDARKKQCPIPIIMAKDAMKEVDVIEIIVDNEIAMQNLYKLAKQKNYQIQSEKKDNDY